MNWKDYPKEGIRDRARLVTEILERFQSCKCLIISFVQRREYDTIVQGLKGLVGDDYSWKTEVDKNLNEGLIQNHYKDILRLDSYGIFPKDCVIQNYYHESLIALINY